MSRLSFLSWGMLVAESLAQRSTCARKAVGCVLLDSRKRILATGYNGVIKDAPHCNDYPCRGAANPDGDDCEALHAEWNALIQCTKPDSVYYAFVTILPCFRCIKMLCNTGMLELVYKDTHSDEEKVLAFLKKTSVTVRRIN